MHRGTEPVQNLDTHPEHLSYLWKKTDNLMFPGVKPGIKLKKKTTNQTKKKLKQQNPLRSRVSYIHTGWFFRKNPDEFGFPSAAAGSGHGWGCRITALTAQERTLLHTNYGDLYPCSPRAVTAWERDLFQCLFLIKKNSTFFLIIEGASVKYPMWAFLLQPCRVKLCLSQCSTLSEEGMDTKHRHNLSSAGL